MKKFLLCVEILKIFGLINNAKWGKVSYTSDFGLFFLLMGLKER